MQVEAYQAWRVKDFERLNTDPTPSAIAKL